MENSDGDDVFGQRLVRTCGQLISMANDSNKLARHGIRKEVWDTLMNIYIYETSHLQTKWYSNKQVYTLKMSKEDTIANRVNTYHTLIDNLASTRTNISDYDCVIVLLGSLPACHERLAVFICDQPN